MSGFDVILILLIGVVATHGIGHALGNRIAVPIIQIAAGALIGTTTDLGVRLHPDLFFLLFLPPLLFLDGWRIPADVLKNNAPSILSLAFGLVFFTVAGIGLLLHVLIPLMPLSVCVALAAVLAPTDVVAAGAMMTGNRVPQHMLRLLEGEALFNDAAGLVCMRLAIVATLSGAFSLGDAVELFAWTSVGGVAIGVASTWLISRAKYWVATRLGEVTSSQILVSLMMPYAAYLIADRLACSAVLAAVAAGMTMSRIEMQGIVLPVTRVRRSTIWDTVQFTLNGMIFLILGEQTPEVLAHVGEGMLEDGHPGMWRLATYVAIITVALVVLRFLWIGTMAAWPFGWRRAAWVPGGRVDWILVSAMSTGGVRGAVTLAGAMSLPLALPGGGAFPARDLVICLAAGVILASLVLANLTLPRLLRLMRLPPEVPDVEREQMARIGAAEAALAALVAAKSPHPEVEAAFLATAASISEDYQRRIARLRPRAATPGAKGDVDGVQLTLGQEQALRLLAIKAERNAILRMTRLHQIPGGLARTLLRETDLAEAALEGASQAP